MNIQLYFSGGAISNVDIQSDLQSPESLLIPYLRNYVFLRSEALPWPSLPSVPDLGEYRVIGKIQNAEELDAILHSSGESSIAEQFDSKIIFSPIHHGETPPGVKITKTCRELPYRIVFGALNQPKVFTATCDAVSAWDAWNSLRYKLDDIIGFPAENLLIYEVSLGRVPCHQFLMRNRRTYLDFSTRATRSIWISLVDDLENVRTKIEKLRNSNPSSYRHGITDSDATCDTKSNNVSGSLVREIVVSSYPEIEVDKVDCEHISRSLSSALQSHDEPHSFAPLVVRKGVALTDHLGVATAPKKDMFSFRPEERAALESPPSMRFLVLNNIPPGRDLTVREKQAWCDFHQKHSNKPSGLK